MPQKDRNVEVSYRGEREPRAVFPELTPVDLEGVTEGLSASG